MAENYGGFIPPPRGPAIYFIWFILFYESGEIMKRIFFGGCKIKIEWLIGISNETFLFQRMAVSATFVGSNPTRRMIFFSCCSVNMTKNGVENFATPHSMSQKYKRALATECLNFRFPPTTLLWKKKHSFSIAT